MCLVPRNEMASVCRGGPTKQGRSLHKPSCPACFPSLSLSECVAWRPKTKDQSETACAKGRHHHVRKNEIFWHPLSFTPFHHSLSKDVGQARGREVASVSTMTVGKSRYHTLLGGQVVNRKCPRLFRTVAGRSAPLSHAACL